MKPHPWTESVHTAMTKLGLSLTRAQIVDLYGKPAGKQTADDRISVAISRGWFHVAKREEGGYLYTAIDRPNSRPEWSPQDDELLARLWPGMGCKCLSLFPGRTMSALRTHAAEMKLRRAKLARKTKIAVKVPGAERISFGEPLVTAKADRRTGKNCFGFLPEGRVSSVFQLAQTLEAA